jgi:hypothetical protein
MTWPLGATELVHELVHGLGAAELCVEVLVRRGGGRAGWRLTGEEVGRNEKNNRWE